MQFCLRHLDSLAPLAAGLAIVLAAGILAFGPLGGPDSSPATASASASSSELPPDAQVGQSASQRSDSQSSRGSRGAEASAGGGAAGALSGGPARMLSRVPVAGLKVGIQAGHWKAPELPEELKVLRGSTGAQGKGWTEVEISLDISRRVAKLLQDAGVQVDLLPSTVPPGYKADAFVSIHGDANSNTSLSGFKTAGARWSIIPDKDNALVRAINSEYQAGTGLREHPGTITENMRQYYGFNWRSFKHTVDPTTPAVLLELGFLTTPGDLKLLQQEPDRVAEAVARGIIKFLVP